MKNTIIIEGHFVNSDLEFDSQVEVNLHTGLITRIGNDLGTPQVSFEGGKYIFPGFSDIHIHAREDETGKQNYKEDYNFVNEAAINGGVIAVCPMPNTPSPLLTDEQLHWHQNKHGVLPVFFLNYVGIGPGTKPIRSNIPYKAYTGPSVGPLFFKSEFELKEALQHYKGKHVSFHVEDFEILELNKNKEDHSLRRPPECVETALVYVLKLIEEFDLKAKLCHWPIGGNSLQLIKEHREKGFKTTIEVSPLHLYFDYKMLEKKPELWPYVQMNPALQTESDRLQLIEKLKEGFIDFLATDHAPHTIEEKFKNFIPSESSGLLREEYYKQLLEEKKKECQKLSKIDSISGTTQLDTYSLIAAWLIKEHDFTVLDIARVCSDNPGKFINQFLRERHGKGFGRIEVGYQGSFTVLNLNETTVVKREDLKTKSKWSPFEEIEFPCRVEAVFIQGKRVK